MSVSKGISIIICTYNGGNRLPDTLSHLSNQVFNCPCELVVIDNCSEDKSKDISDKWWAAKGVQQITYRSYLEPRKGKTFALELGLKVSSYGYVIICDDDNWLAPDYVQRAFDLMESNSMIGALGGIGTAVFESEKPIWWEDFKHFFATGPQGNHNGDITDSKGHLYGAGMVIRKTAWVGLIESGYMFRLTCERRNGRLIGGEDTELCYALRILGYRIWYDNNLRFEHYITSGRLNDSYLIRLHKAISEASFIVSAYLDEINDAALSRRLLGPSKLDIKTLFMRSTNLLRGNLKQRGRSIMYFYKVRNMIFRFNEYKKIRFQIAAWREQIKYNISK